MINLDQHFQTWIEQCESSEVTQAMSYSFLNGGKRIRSKLMVAVCKSYGIPENRAIPFAMALEMIHTYSLVHDDLPAMDNDDLRRGKNSCHIQFDEATAILAGDGLLTEAFHIISTAQETADIRLEMIRICSYCAGINGMILGQTLDMEAENKQISWEDLKKLHHCKTGHLFAASCMMGATLSKQTHHLEVWKEIGEEIGLAFQIQDDIFDVIKTSEEMGKTTSDIQNDKNTSVSILGLEAAQLLLKEIFASVYSRLSKLEPPMTEVIELLQVIESRDY